MKNGKVGARIQCCNKLQKLIDKMKSIELTLHSKEVR